jgi:nicrotizing toxin Mtb-like protein
VAQPTQLTPTEQDALVKQIGLAMLRVAPDDWEQLTVDYRAVGRYAESTGQVTFTDGSAEPWEMPADLRGLFARLRGGMYREGRGTWFNARYRLDHPSSYNLEYDRDEPVWDLPPPPQAYPDDMRLFPRSDENVPEWLRRRLAAAPPPGPAPGTPDRPPGPPPTPRFRVARIFDGPGEDGRPSVNRPPVDEMDIQDILDYLDGAPLVGPARGYDVDRLDPNGQQSVPVAFHTDGTWIWPAAVNYYLREHDISPEVDLIEHIRRMRFKLVPVDEPVRVAAQQFLGPPPGAPGPGPGGPGPGPGPGPRPGPPAPAPTRAMPVPAPVPAPAPAGPPRAALPSTGPASQQIDQLRARLDDLDVPETAYQIGAPAGRGWVMEQADEGWRVGWHDRGEWVAPAMFEDVADASAFLLGKLMLDTDRWAAGPKNPELTPKQPAPAPEDVGGFQPMSAPIEAFEPMAAPLEDYGSPAPAPTPPAGPVQPPPGTPGYTDMPRHSDSPAFADSSSGYGDRSYADSPGRFSEFTEPSDGFAPPPRPGPPPGTPPRPAPAPTMAMEPPRGFDLDSSSHGLDSHGFEPPGRGLESPGRGLDTPSRGLDTPGRGLDSPGRGLDSPPRGIESPVRDQSTVLAPRPTNGAAAAPAGSEWPITPLPGEPPLTLFRGKRVIELEPGTEFDRFGDDDGNLVYALGTPFSERSLVPEWIDRPYHVYRVRQPFQALTGAAIPWFDQPGGGTAYLLPDAIGDLVAHGHIVEVNDRERPPD